MWSIGQNENWKGKQQYSEKLAPVPICPQQILAWDQTKVIIAGSQQLTT
jgi:hypothetical protein